MEAGTEHLRRYVADRSEAAFASLVQQHLSLVYHAALRRTNGDTHLAEEVAQAVFANLAREAGSLQHHAVLTGWLYVATRHAAANAMRSEQRRKAREREALVMNEENSQDQSGGEWERLRPELDSVMDELNETDRNAVLLRFFENRTYADIGTSFRISEDAARMRVDRALEKLRTQLARRGITSTAAALGGLLAAQSAVAAPAGLANAVTGSVLAGTGAVAASTGSAGLIAFMTTNKITLGIAGAMVLVAGGTAVYELKEAQNADLALVSLNREVSELKDRLVRQQAEMLSVEEKRKVAEAQLISLGKARQGADSATSRGGGPPMANSGAAPKTMPANSFAGKLDVLYANSEYVQLEMEKVALGLGLRYGPLYRQLGLTDGQIKAFESLMLENQQSTIDLFAAARASGVSVNDPSLKKVSDPTIVETQKKLEALLGPTGFAAFMAFSTAPASNARTTVDSLASKLYATANPISPEQAQLLIGVIVANTPNSTGTGFIRETAQPNWPKIYSQAKSILSPQQLAALEATNRSMELARLQSKLADRLMQEAAASAAK